MSTTIVQDDKTRRRERAAELRSILSAPSEKERAAQELDEIERAEAAELEAEARDAASQRCKAISRAVGGVISAFEQDEHRVAEAARAYADAVAQLNARYGQIIAFRAESEALVDRFTGVAGAKVPAVVAPDRGERIIAAARLLESVAYARDAVAVPMTEECQHRLRRRRSYAEIAGSAGYEIITRAGLRDFPPLNETQQRMLKDREREQIQERQNMKAIGPLAHHTTAELNLASGRGAIR